MFDLISIGDTVVDTFVPIKDAEVKIIEGERKLLLRYGDKIPVEPFLTLVGGNAANNAVGSSRLNLKTAIYTHLGNDLHAHQILETFKKEKVSLDYVVRDDHLPSNHHIVLDFQGERTILTYHQPWKYHLPDLDQTRWVYLTSLFTTVSETNFMDQLINYLERTGAKLFFNPGTFQIKMGVKKNKRLLSLTEVFIVNLEEAKLVLGHDEADKISPKKLLKGLSELGPRQIVVTDGKKGSYCFDGENYYQLEAFPSKIVETTGAGDAYSTGTLAGLFYGHDLKEAIRWGSANGAAVVEEIGPEKGLLSHHKMQERLSENKTLVAKEL
jgi:sugar/nucleoside kinase (ribokinase family)